jgi:hypothetical protein
MKEKQEFNYLVMFMNHNISLAKQLTRRVNMRILVILSLVCQHNARRLLGSMVSTISGSEESADG